MRQLRMTSCVWLFAGSVILGLNTDSVRGQGENAKDDTKKAEAQTEDKAEKKDNTAWPPKDAEKHEVKRGDDQQKGLLLYTPKSWKKEDPQSNFRLAEFSIPAAEGDDEPGELAVFSFAGGGGGLQANIDRWIGQFDAKGREVKVTQGEGEQGLYVLVDVKGTYNKPDGPPILQKTKPMPNSRMLAAITVVQWMEDGEKKGAVYFLKMPGPEKTITTNEEAFRQAFGAAPKDKEKELKVKDQSAN